MGFGKGGKRLYRSSSEAIDGAYNQGTTGTPAATREVKSRGHIVIPYTQGLCESIKKICGRYSIQTDFKGGSTIKNLLVSPKDKDPMVNQSDAIYWYQCGDLGCDDEYIGETSRTFGKRYKEHLKDPSPIHHHNNQTNHPINHNNFKIIGRGVLPAWEQPDCLPKLLFWEACEALSLAEYLTVGAAWGLTAWETSLSAWERALSTREAWGLVLSAWERALSAGEDRRLPVWETGKHLSRYIKESIFVRVNNPTLNNNVGKFNLPHIWDRVLINTPGLKLNK